MFSSQARYFLYGTLLSASVISLSVQAGTNDGVFGDYFTNIIQNNCTNSTLVTWFELTPYGKPKCSTIQSILASVFSSSSAPEGQAMLWFNTDGSIKYGDVNWRRAGNTVSTNNTVEISWDLRVNNIISPATSTITWNGAWLTNVPWTSISNKPFDTYNNATLGNISSNSTLSVQNNANIGWNVNIGWNINSNGNANIGGAVSASVFNGNGAWVTNVAAISAPWAGITGKPFDIYNNAWLADVSTNNISANGLIYTNSYFQSAWSAYIGWSIQTSSVVYTPWLCLNGDCRYSWPVAPPQVVWSCPTGQAINAIYSDGTVWCVALPVPSAYVAPGGWAWDGLGVGGGDGGSCGGVGGDCGW